MTHLPLSCPRCQRWLVYVPLDGFTLHYRCPVHGAVILRPLVEVDADSDETLAAAAAHPRLRIRDVA